MKSKVLLTILAMLPVLLIPVQANGEGFLHLHKRSGSHIEEKKPQAPVELKNKYSVFAGYSYTSLHQVNQSRYGLQGPQVTVTRDFTKYVGFSLDGSYQKWSMQCCNPGTPSVTTILTGPVFHAPLASKLDAFGRVLIGGAHTGGESMTPSVSFAGGYDIGMDWKFSKRMAFRASGGDIISSFVADPNKQGYSPHKHGNSRAAFGIVYSF